MRTKTLLLTAMIGAAGVFSTYAQSTNIYSVNVVGYTTATADANKFVTVANQLTNSSVALANILPNVTDGTRLYIWKGSDYKVVLFVSGFGWYDEVNDVAAGDVTFQPGEGAFMHNQSSAVALTFTGDVMQGDGLNLTSGANVLNLISSLVPTSGDVSTMGFPTTVDLDFYKWSYAAQDWVLTQYIVGTGWYDPINDMLVAPPTVGVGESFFVKPAAAFNWTRNFHVN